MSKATSTGAAQLSMDPTIIGSSSGGGNALPRTRKSEHVSRSCPAWRLEELAHKYAPVDAYEPDEVCDE